MEQKRIKDACKCEWVRFVHVYFSEFTCFPPIKTPPPPRSPCRQVGKKEKDVKEEWGELDGQEGGGDMTLAAKQ